jgi:hypothetical protein
MRHPIRISSKDKIINANETESLMTWVSVVLDSIRSQKYFDVPYTKLFDKKLK